MDFLQMDHNHLNESPIKVTGAQKRKQFLFRSIVNEGNAYNFGNHVFQNNTLMPRLTFRTPLYLLNPLDFTNDPIQQLKIKRARSVFEYRQRRKEQMKKLCEENMALRALCDSMRCRIFSMENCTCGAFNRVRKLELNHQKSSKHKRNSNPLHYVPVKEDGGLKITSISTSSEQKSSCVSKQSMSGFGSEENEQAEDQETPTVAS